MILLPVNKLPQESLLRRQRGQEGPVNERLNAPCYVEGQVQDERSVHLPPDPTAANEACSSLDLSTIHHVS